MRSLWVAVHWLPAHTPHMAFDTEPTTLVASAAGLVGAERVKVLANLGHQVIGVTESDEGAARLRHIGGTAVLGDLLVPHRWHDAATADWVFHVAPQQPQVAQVHHKRTESIASARVLMDSHLLDTVLCGSARRIVRTAHASCPGHTGLRAIAGRPKPCHPRRCSTARERLAGCVVFGVRIASTLPAWVYGSSSLFRERVVEPIVAGRGVLTFADVDPLVSSVLIRDHARMLVHLAQRGEIDGRYFVVNSDAAQMNEFASTVARVAGRPLRVWQRPEVAPLSLNAPDVPHADNVFSDVRLRGIRFRFLYPTLERGLPQLIAAIHE